MRCLEWIKKDNEDAQLQHNVAILLIESHLDWLEKWMDGPESCAGAPFFFVSKEVEE